MTKVRSPFLSFGSQGTIGSALTSQRLGSATMVRSKPVPANPRSLPQMYQRWLYQDYAHFWTLQDASTRQQYAAAGVRYHLTGFQYWMKYHLKFMPDIAAWWRFDHFIGNQTPDSGPNAITATFYGAYPVPGRISQALYFDGVNDWCDCTAHPALDLTTSFTINLWLYTPSDGSDYPAWAGVLVKWECFAIVLNYGVIYAGLQWPVGPMFWLNSGVSVTAGTWYHIVLTFNNVIGRFYVNGEQKAYLIRGGPINSKPTRIVMLGTWAWAPGQYAYCRLDNLLVLNRVQDAIEIKRHSERRYPLQ